VAIAVSSDDVEFRFAEAVSLFMLIVSRGDEIVWELVANEGNMVEAGEGSFSITPIDQGAPEMLEMANQAEVMFLARVREGPPLTTPISLVRYGVIPRGYREASPAQQLAPGRYGFIAMSAQGQAAGEFDVPAA